MITPHQPTNFQPISRRLAFNQRQIPPTGIPPLAPRANSCIGNNQNKREKYAFIFEPRGGIARRDPFSHRLRRRFRRHRGTRQ